MSRSQTDATLAFTCDGARIELRADSRSALAAASTVLPPGASRQPFAETAHVSYRLRQTDDAIRIYRGGRFLHQDAEFASALQFLQSALHESVARHATRLYVHAGVVGWKGRAILIPGTSFSGKSSLVAELVKQGALYYSDEYAVLDDDGLVHGYGKPVSLRPRHGDGPTALVPARQLGGRTGRKPLPLGAVVVTQYRPGAAFEPSPLSSAECMMALMANTVMARSRPVQTMSTLSRAVANASGLQGARGEAGPAARHLLELLA